MRQRSLNGVLAGAVAGVICLLTATACFEVKLADAGIACAGQNRVIGRPPGKCEKCPVTACYIPDDDS